MSSEDSVHVKLSLHIKIEFLIMLNDLIPEGELPCGEVTCRGQFFTLQMIQQTLPTLLRVHIFFSTGMVGRHGHIVHRPCLPAVHDMNSGKLPLIEVDIKDTCHLAGILHALHGHLLELLRRDRLPISEQADEFTGSMIEVLEVVP